MKLTQVRMFRWPEPRNMAFLCYIFDGCTMNSRYSNAFTGAIKPRVSKSQSGPLATSLESNCYPNSIETMLLLRVKSARQAPTTTQHLNRIIFTSTAEQSKSPAPGALSNAQSVPFAHYGSVLLVHSGIPTLITSV
jgi:hypothetical protein